jgi:hypothetical protein
MSDTDTNTLEDKFYRTCYTLTREDIHKLEEKDNGPLHNVIANIAKQCYGAILFEQRGGLSVDLYYVSNEPVLKGDIIILQVGDPDYYNLLLKFCIMLANDHQDVDAIDAFNTFQTKVRSFLDKYGYFTIIPSDIKPFEGKNAVMISPSKRGIIKVDMIDKVEFYRNIFHNNYNAAEGKVGEFIYLMVNSRTSLIKIGFSRNPGYRERTLHSQEPEITLVACWEGTRKTESELHSYFKAKRIRGEWFRLTLADLFKIEEKMN